MSKQTTADVPGVFMAAIGVSVGDAGSVGRATDCAGDASGFAVSAFVMAGTGMRGWIGGTPEA